MLARKSTMKMILGRRAMSTQFKKYFGYLILFNTIRISKMINDRKLANDKTLDNN